MIPIRVWALFATVAILPAAAQAQFADVSVSVQPSRDAAFTWRTPVGPIALSSTSRGGSFRLAADYGAVSTTARARVVGLMDGRNDVPPATSHAAWLDTLTLTDPFASGTGGVTAIFAFTSTASAAATTNSTVSGTRGSSLAEFQLFAGTEVTAMARVIGRGLVTDGVGTAPRPSYQVSTQPGFLYSFTSAPSFSLPTIPTSPVRLEVAMFLPFGRSLNFGMSASCSIGMTSFRILDSTSGQCASSAMFDGLVGLYDSFGNPLDPGLYNGVGASGFDYFRPAPRQAQRLAIAAVPEPATWAMLIVGFGLVGHMARRRRIVAPG